MLTPNINGKKDAPTGAPGWGTEPAQRSAGWGREKPQPDRLGKQVVVVGFDPFTLGSEKNLCDYFGYNAITATDWANAMELFAKKGNRVGLAIIDSDILGLDRLWILGQMRANHPEIKVVFIIANVTAEVRDTLIRAGASDVLNKPFNGHAFGELLSANLPL